MLNLRGVNFGGDLNFRYPLCSSFGGFKSSDPEELEENCHDGETLQAAWGPPGRWVAPSGPEFWWVSSTGKSIKSLKLTVCP